MPAVSAARAEKSPTQYRPVPIYEPISGPSIASVFVVTLDPERSFAVLVPPLGHKI
jgi:hypothetical protein